MYFENYPLCRLIGGALFEAACGAWKAGKQLDSALFEAFSGACAAIFGAAGAEARTKKAGGDKKSLLAFRDSVKQPRVRPDR